MSMNRTENRGDDQTRAKIKRQIRSCLSHYVRPSYTIGIGLLIGDLVLYVAGITLALMTPAVLVKLAGAGVAGLAIARLFVLGHDAIHLSLTPSRRINSIVGWITLLPTYTCPSLWRAGHNVAHHGFPGLRGRDIPWVPLSPADYCALSALRRRIYRVYRSWWGAWLYYGTEIWWKQLIFPRGKSRKEFTRQSLIVTIFFVVQCIAIAIGAELTRQSALILFLVLLVVPFVVWLNLAAHVFFLHHTDATAKWFDNESDWRSSQPDLEGIHHTRLPLGLHYLLHNALVHTAHHLNASIPSYRLPAAQRALAAAFPDRVDIKYVGFLQHARIMSACQLYDFKHHQWYSTRSWSRCTGARTSWNAKQITRTQ